MAFAEDYISKPVQKEPSTPPSIDFLEAPVVKALKANQASAKASAGRIMTLLSHPPPNKDK